MQGIQYLAIYVSIKCLNDLHCIYRIKSGIHNDTNVFDAKSNPLTTDFTFPY